MLAVSDRARLLFVLSLVYSITFTIGSCSGDTITLWNLETVEKDVASFNFDGVLFQDGTSLDWSMIKSGTLSSRDQTTFDSYLKNVGQLLYRIRIRLQSKDYKGAGENAEAIYKHYRTRNSKMAYLVCQAIMWARLADGHRAAAVDPYLRCYAILKSSPGLEKSLPGDRRLKYDAKSGVCDELQPIWFDKVAVEKAMPAVTATIRELNSPPPAARIYFASMAMTTGKSSFASSILAGLNSTDGSLGELVMILKSQNEVENGTGSVTVKALLEQSESLSESNRPLAYYWCGIHQAKTDLDGGLLLLLRVPALYGERHPDLAAAAISAALKLVTSADQNQRASVLRRELLESFPDTFHAKNLLLSLIHI